MGISGMAIQDDCPPPDFAGAFPQPECTADVLAAHDESVARAIENLSTLDDAMMAGQWRLVHDGETLMELPRAAFIRTVLLNHVIHHRGQLQIYLRMLGAKVPYVYGPSGDEAPPEFARMMEVLGTG